MQAQGRQDSRSLRQQPAHCWPGAQNIWVPIVLFVEICGPEHARLNSARCRQGRHSATNASARDALPPPQAGLAQRAAPAAPSLPSLRPSWPHTGSWPQIRQPRRSCRPRREAPEATRCDAVARSDHFCEPSDPPRCCLGSAALVAGGIRPRTGAIRTLARGPPLRQTCGRARI